MPPRANADSLRGYYPLTMKAFFISVEQHWFSARGVGIFVLEFQTLSVK